MHKLQNYNQGPCTSRSIETFYLQTQKLLLPSDQISLSARVISSEYNAPAALMKDCEVAVKQFHVHFTAVDDGKDSSGGPGNRSLNYLHETGHFIPDLDPSLLYAASNSYTLHYPF